MIFSFNQATYDRQHLRGYKFIYPCCGQYAEDSALVLTSRYADCTGQVAAKSKEPTLYQKRWGTVWHSCASKSTPVPGPVYVRKALLALFLPKFSASNPRVDIRMQQESALTRNWKLHDLAWLGNSWGAKNNRLIQFSTFRNYGVKPGWEKGNWLVKYHGEHQLYCKIQSHIASHMPEVRLVS